MASDAQLIDMGRLRTLLVAAQRSLRESGDTHAPLALVTEALELLNPRRDPDAAHPSVDPQAVTNAITSAHEILIAGGLENPVEILIVQTHDAQGKTTGRSLASSAANPQDLLRVCLRNVERSVDDATIARRKQRRDFLENT